MRKLAGFITRHPRTTISVAAVIAAAVWLRCGSLPPGLLDADERPSTTVVDRHGERLSEVRSSSGQRSQAISPDDLPRTLALATLAAEDVRFRSHLGLDPFALVRAAVHDLQRGRIVEGGSTISQQVAKLLLARQPGPRPRRGWATKINEAVIALRLEHRLTKNEILALYLNLAPYGNQIQGAERASLAYFGRSASTLTPTEAAFLAALPQQPTRYNPWRDPTSARPRALHILRVMNDRGWLDAPAYAVARDERVSLSRDPARLLAPHFVERVLSRAGKDRRRRIETTLDAGLQRTVEGIIASHRPALEDHHATSVAVVVLDVRQGEWLAWEGSGNYFDTANAGTIDGAVSPRQPGSALKPFTYAAAFERGSSPARVLADVPSPFPTAQPGVLYSPRNYDGEYRGPLLARVALAGSENIPAVVLASDVGVPTLARLLRQAGLSTLDRNAAHYGLGLTLGNAEVRLDELVAAYAMIARGGEALPPRMIRAIDGRATPAGTPVRVLSTRTAFWITDILADPEARAYAFGRGGSLEFPFTVAAKTGTSQAYRDNWAIGYTSDVAVGVWVGNFDRTPLRGSSGVTGAGPIFHDVMLAAVERARGALPIGDRAPIVAPTADVRRVELCAESGLRPTDACPTRVIEWVPAGAAPETCTWHHATPTGTVTVWPEIFRPWARSVGRLTTASLAPAPSAIATKVTAQSTVAATDRGLSIVAPLGGAVYSIDSTLRAEFQMLSFRARGGTPGRREWFVDGAPVGVSTSDDAVRWRLARGTHEVTVRDADGHEALTSFVVR
ncbi:MAG TPA: penicillin-binding protein 1C [Vicinamibacterales bacterium]|nr:penicillin-binding protein 1C [Vicinamibacterales bacterium]